MNDFEIYLAAAGESAQKHRPMRASEWLALAQSIGLPLAALLLLIFFAR